MAELVYVLEFSDEVPRRQVAALTRSILGVPAVTVIDQGPLLRAVEVYEVDRLHLADAYLVSCAERAGEAAVASFGRVVDRVPLTCVEPGVALSRWRGVHLCGTSSPTSWPWLALLEMVRCGRSAAE